jgi:hypothetical protein
MIGGKLMLNTIKLKLIAAGSVFVIAILAALKWLYASNKAKKAKIEKLKREAKVAKVVQEMHGKTSSLEGFQEAIDLGSDKLSQDTQEADDKRSADDKNDVINGTTSVTV